MKSKIIFFTYITCISLALTSGTNQTQSNGAPLGSTGGPGESTCGQVGCHIGNNGSNNINTGNGILNISADGNIAQYVPNQIYNLTVSINQNSIERFGFSLTALGADSLSIGNLIVTEPTTTQLLDGIWQYAGKDYMTYTALGTSPTIIGQKEWSFQWQAPAQYEGPVKFYAAAVAANNDGTDNGDWVYTTSYDGLENSIQKLPSTPRINFEVFPNPITSKTFFIDLEENITGQVKISLHHLNGSLATLLFDGLWTGASTPIPFNKPELPTGFYLVSVQTKEQSTSKQIFIQN